MTGYKYSLVNNRLFIPDSGNLKKNQIDLLSRLYELNSLSSSDIKRKDDLLREMFKSIGENPDIALPLYANWAGHFTSIGDNFISGEGLNLIEEGGITIGNNVRFGRDVTIITRTSPDEAELRQRGYMLKDPVKIGDNVLIGSGTLIMPNVTLGRGVVVDQGTVVKDSFPDFMHLAGNPAVIIGRVKR